MAELLNFKDKNSSSSIREKEPVSRDVEVTTGLRLPLHTHSDIYSKGGKDVPATFSGEKQATGSFGSPLLLLLFSY